MLTKGDDFFRQREYCEERCRRQSVPLVSKGGQAENQAEAQSL